jgi:NAD(P)H-dependent FMN reductase
MRILAVCGSLQAKSSNLSLLQKAVALAPQGVEVILFDGLRDLPLFNPDIEDSAPAAVLNWKSALAESAAVLIACPEYGHSLPGALKNAIDWVIGSGELYQKVVAITAAVGDANRGRRGLDALAQTLRAVDASIAWTDPVVLGPELDAELDALLRTLVSACTS